MADKEKTGSCACFTLRQMYTLQFIWLFCSAFWYRKRNSSGLSASEHETCRWIDVISCSTYFNTMLLCPRELWTWCLLITQIIRIYSYWVFIFMRLYSLCLSVLLSTYFIFGKTWRISIKFRFISLKRKLSILIICTPMCWRINKSRLSTVKNTTIWK